MQLAVTDNPVEALVAPFAALLLFVSIRVKVVNSVLSELLRDEQHRLIAAWVVQAEGGDTASFLDPKH